MAYRTELVRHGSKKEEQEWKVKITFPSAANATDYMNQVNAIEAGRAAVPAPFTEPTTVLVKLPSAASPKQEGGNKNARIIFEEGAEKAKVWLCQTGLEPCFRGMQHQTIHLCQPHSNTVKHPFRTNPGRNCEQKPRDGCQYTGYQSCPARDHKPGPRQGEQNRID